MACPQVLLSFIPLCVQMLSKCVLFGNSEDNIVYSPVSKQIKHAHNLVIIVHIFPIGHGKIIWLGWYSSDKKYVQ
jgi:hypothetical protein